jgi:hypothetical protein
MLFASFPPRLSVFKPSSGHVGFVVDEVGPGQIFPEYFSIFCQLPFHQLLHNHPHLSSGAGTIVQLVAGVPNGLSLTQSDKLKKKVLSPEGSADNAWEPSRMKFVLFPPPHI